MELVEEDRIMKASSSDNKNKLLEAFKALEDFMKQFIQSLDEKPRGKTGVKWMRNISQKLIPFMAFLDNERSLNGSTASSTFEKMPGTFDFDNAPSDTTLSEPSMQTAPAAAPIFLKDPSFGNHSESPHARQNEKEPALNSPSPLPQMNDAAAAFMSGGLKPISNRNLNGDDAKPNNAHENDTLRSNVLDSLRNAAMNDTALDEDHNKESEVLAEEEPHERGIRSTPYNRGITSNIGVKPTATPSSFSNQPSDSNSKLEPPSAISAPSDTEAEDALVPLAASVATVAAATAAAAVALSDNSKNDSHSATPLNTTPNSYNPETFQGGLGGDSSEPFIKNAKDTELAPEDQPSFGAEQAKLNMLDGTDNDSTDHTNVATADFLSSLPKLNESNQYENESKPFESEAFQGGLGGNSTEPYIKNEKDTLLKPQDQPSFGAEQERMSKLNSANKEEIESGDMEQSQVSKTFASKGPNFVPESFQGGLGGDGIEPYIKNEKDTLLKPEGQPSFGVEQEKLKEAEDMEDLKDTYRDTEPSPSLGSTLSKIGAGATGIAGAAALNLSEQQDSDKNKDTSTASSPINDASSRNLTSPHKVYSPSLTFDNNLQDANPADVISNEALDSIADKVDADIKHNSLQDDTTAADAAGIISSDALDKIADNVDAVTENDAIPSSVSMYMSPQQDVHVLVEQDTSLPPNIGNEVDIATTNNDSNRSPLSDNAAMSPAVFGNNNSGTASPGSNSDYTGGSSTMPDSTSHAPLVTNTAGSRSPALDAANTPHVSSTSRSLNPSDATKDATPKDSSKDDADSKEDKPGFFKKLFGGRSKSPEPASRSMSTTTDKAASKESTASPADGKDASTIADAPIADKIHAFNVNTNADLPSLNNNAFQDMSPNAHADDAFIKSPEFNVNVPSATFNSNVGASKNGPSDTDSKLESSFNTHKKVDNDMKSPRFNANINADASGLSPSLEKLSADIKGLSDNVSSNFGGSVRSPNVNARLPSLDAELSGPQADLPNVDGKLDDSINMPNVGITLPSLSTDMKTPNLDKPSLGTKLSGSIDIPDSSDKLPSMSPGISGPDAGLSNVGGKLDGSISTPGIDGKLPSFSSDIKTPSADVPSVDGSFKTPATDAKLPAVGNNLKSPRFHADVSTDRPDLTGSLGRLSSSFKGLKGDISGKLRGSMDTPDIDAASPSLHADLEGPNVGLPHIDGMLPPLDADVKTPKLDRYSLDGSFDTPHVDGKPPSMDTDVNVPNVDLPHVSGEHDRSISGPGIDGNVKSPSFNASVNMDDVGLSGSLEKLSAGLKSLKGDIFGKFEGSNSTPNMDAELPNVDAKMNTGAELPHINGKMPSLSSDLETPKLGKPSVDSKLTGSMNTPSIDGKLPSLDARIEGPEMGVPNVGGTLDRSLSAPDANIDVKSPGFDGSMNVNAFGLSGSLGKLSAGLKGLKDDISGKLDGSLESPNIDVKAPSFDVNMKSPSADLTNVDGTLDNSIETPDIDGKLPSLSSDIKTPSVHMANVGGKLDGSAKTPDIDAKLPSVDSDLKSPALDANVNVERPDLSGSLGRLSYSFKDLKDGISGKLSGETPSVDGELPSFNADMKRSELFDVNKEMPSLDTDLSTPKLGNPSLGGKMNATLNTPEIHGKLPSVEADLQGPDVNLPAMSGKLDRSISAPDVKADLKTPEFDSDVGLDAPGISASLGKLSAGLKDLKSDISSRFNGSIESPNVDDKLPVMGANLKSSGADLPKVGDEFDGLVKTPDMDGKLPLLKSDLKDLDADLPHVDTNFKETMSTPNTNVKLPSLDGDLKTPKANLGADVDASRPSLSGSLGKLSSSFKDLKKGISGTFSDSVNTPELDGKMPTLDADVKRRNVKLPDINKELPSLKTGMKGPNVNSPDMQKELPSLDASIDGKLGGAVDAPDLDGKLPSLNADINSPNVELPNASSKLGGSVNAPVIDLPDIHKELPSLDASLDGKLDDSVNIPDLDGKLPSLNADVKSPQVDLPSLNGEMNGSASTPDINAKLHAIEGNLKTPDVNLDAKVDASRPSLSGLGKLSSSFKGLKDSISGKFNGSAESPHVDGELPSLDPELPDPKGKLPDLRADVDGVKFGMPAIDDKLTNYIDPPTADAKLPALDADVKGPDVDLAHVDGKLDRPIDGGIKSPGFHANVDMDASSLSGSLGKLSAGLKDLQSDISGKFDGSVDSPNMDGKLPTLDGEFKAPSTDLSNVSGKLAGSVETPDIDGKLPSLSSDIKTPSAGMPHVDAKLDGAMSAPDIDAKLPSIGGDMNTPNVNLDADVDGSRPSLSGTLGKLSSSSKDLKDGFSGKLGGDVPNIDGKLPSVNVDLERPNVDLPDVDSKTPLLDADMKTPKLEKPSLDGSLVDSLNTPSIDGKLPSLDADVKAPNVDLPHVSGKLDRSISAPDLDSDVKSPNLNANVNLDAADISGSLGELPAGLKGLTNNISGKLDGSWQSPSIDSKLPTLDASLEGPSMDLPDIDGKLDGSTKTPHYDGMLPSLDANVKAPQVDMPDVDGKYDGALNADIASPKVNLPYVSGKLDTSIHTPTVEATLPSVDSDMTSPEMGVDANVDAERPGLSGALGKLSSSFKELKDDLTGVFSGSADAPGVDVNTDYTSPEFGLPDADLGLDGSVEAPKMSGNLPSKEREITAAPQFKLSRLDTDLEKGISSNLPDVSARLGGDMTAPKADVDVPDLHSPSLDASADGNTSSAPVAPPRKIGLSGSLGKMDAALTTPKADVDVPQMDVPVAPPRSPRLSLNKLSFDAPLDSSVDACNMDVDTLETSSGFNKGPAFHVHVNGKPALKDDLATGLHRTATSGGDMSADKTTDEGSSSSFSSKPMDKMSSAIHSVENDMSEDDDDAAHNNKATAGYAHLRTRSRTESPGDLSAMLDDIVKRRFSNTPSESDASSIKSDKKANKKESASSKSRQMVSFIQCAYLMTWPTTHSPLCRMLLLVLVISVQVSLSLVLPSTVLDLAHVSLTLASRSWTSKRATLLNTRRL